MFIGYCRGIYDEKNRVFEMTIHGKGANGGTTI
jgi:hypothetical protein